jgi:hypothetical protein
MTDTASEKRAKRLQTIRYCLALANDPAAEPGEAEAARTRADHLMTAYSIEQWEAETPDRPGERPKPEIRWVSIDWWYDTKDRDSAMALHLMWERVYRHCRCVIAFRGQGKDSAHTWREMPVVGLPSDLDWADQLFTSLMLQLGLNLSPAVDPNGDPGEQVYRQRQSGTDWPEITRRMFQAGLVTLTKGEFKKLADKYPDHFNGMDPEDCDWEDIKNHDWDGFQGGVRESIKNRLANLNRKYVKANGLQGERNYVRPDIYQRSFTEGFSREVRLRLIRMSDEFKRGYDSEHGSGSMDLVVADIRQQAVVLYNQTWPEPPPVKVDPNYKPPRGRSVQVREKARSSAAAHAGAAEARKANLSNTASERIGSPRGLPGA